MGIKTSIVQLTLGEVPASVFLDRKDKRILFVKHGHKNFIDYRDGNDEMAAWTKDSLCIANDTYKYESWHQLKEESSLKKYFKSVLQDF